MEINLHLEDMKKLTELAEISCLLQPELKRRFRKCTDPGDESYEALYIASTLLDPRYKSLLNPVQLNSAKQEVLKLLNCDSSNSSSVHSASSSSCQELEEPPPKKKSWFSHLSKVLEEKVKESLQRASKRPHGGLDELEQYLEKVQTYPDDVESLQFWAEHREMYPALSSVAVDILSTSAPVEGVFSTAGNATTGKRNRLSDKNLERVRSSSERIKTTSIAKKINCSLKPISFLYVKQKDLNLLLKLN